MPQSSPELTPDITDEQVRHRAHQIWLAEGSPKGREHEHWLQAQAELTSHGYSAVPDVGTGDTPEALANRPGSLQAQADVIAAASTAPKRGI